ncbi:hypothetical protein AGRA3207_001944 [Actinomadura graeca]|uniref:Uncharacterized protein n=1 Tax=Actinomadura graeca TaxID=2750812 RepID=A0ABX8QR28_9ACTN|nr:hypothetical protein [Actinomadura graeca]QXJ21120.1 hypothetical protein AGRA3207_001944 [Actinomadura graeca]
MIAITLSALALVVSSYLAIGQWTAQRRANFTSAYLQLLGEYRSVRFQDNLLYIYHRLNAENDPQMGFLSLPDDVREKFYDVVYFFQQLAILHHMGIFDDFILAGTHRQVVRTWDSIAPFVLRQRELSGDGPSYLLRPLEKFAEEARRTDPELMDRILAKKRLRW